MRIQGRFEIYDVKYDGYSTATYNLYVYRQMRHWVFWRKWKWIPAVEGFRLKDWIRSPSIWELQTFTPTQLKAAFTKAVDDYETLKEEWDKYHENASGNRGPDLRADEGRQPAGPVHPDGTCQLACRTQAEPGDDAR